MRDFSYQNEWKKLLTPKIVNYLTAIHEYKGKQELIATRHADVLQNLVEIARIQSGSFTFPDNRNCEYWLNGRFFYVKPGKLFCCMHCMRMV